MLKNCRHSFGGAAYRCSCVDKCDREQPDFAGDPARAIPPIGTPARKLQEAAKEPSPGPIMAFENGQWTSRVPSDASVSAPAVPQRANSMPEDDAQRRLSPMADGLLDYFPNALAYVAEVSKRGSDKHNVGQPMHWARGKSTDHRNKIIRHVVDAGGKDTDGVRHSGNLAWRALALLQEELERAEGCPLSRGSRL